MNAAYVKGIKFILYLVDFFDYSPFHKIPASRKFHILDLKWNV